MHEALVAALARPSVRARLGVVLLAAAALGNARVLRTVKEYHTPRKAVPSVAAYEARYAGLKACLPADAIAGYVDGGRPAPACHRVFALARYVLTPVRLVPGADASWLILDTDAPDGPPPVANAGEWNLVRDFGQGLRLYRREVTVHGPGEKGTGPCFRPTHESPNASTRRKTDQSPSRPVNGYHRESCP